MEAPPGARPVIPAGCWPAPELGGSAGAPARAFLTVWGPEFSGASWREVGRSHTPVRDPVSEVPPSLPLLSVP